MLTIILSKVLQTRPFDKLLLVNSSLEIFFFVFCILEELRSWGKRFVSDSEGIKPGAGTPC